MGLYTFMRRQAFKLVYPAQFIFTPKNKNFIEKHNEFYKEYKYSNKKTQNLRFNMDGDKKLNGISEQEKPNKNNKYIDAALIHNKENNDKNKMFIIHCGENMSCYEWLLERFDEYADLGYNVIGFNPMGVGYSTGVTNGPEDYEAALTAIIENLRLNGIPPENIILSGQSLGAAIATKVAAKYQSEDMRIRVINDRSFAKLDTAAASFIQSFIPTWLLRNTLGVVVYYIVKGFINLFNINIDAKAAFTKINESNPGDAICLCVDDDQIINKESSLAYNLEPEMRQFAKRFICSNIEDTHNTKPFLMHGPTVSLDNDEIPSSGSTYKQNAQYFIQNCLNTFEHQSKAECLSKDLINVLNDTLLLISKSNLEDSLTINLSINDLIHQIETISSQIQTLFYKKADDGAINILLILSDDILKATITKRDAINAAIASEDAEIEANNILTAKYDPQLEKNKFKAAEFQLLASTKRKEANRLEQESNAKFELIIKQVGDISSAPKKGG